MDILTSVHLGKRLHSQTCMLHFSAKHHSKASVFGENRDTQFWKKSPVTSAHFYTYCKRFSVLFNIDKNAAVN